MSESSTTPSMTSPANGGILRDDWRLYLSNKFKIVMLASAGMAACCNLRGHITIRIQRTEGLLRARSFLMCLAAREKRRWLCGSLSWLLSSGVCCARFRFTPTAAASANKCDTCGRAIHYSNIMSGSKIIHRFSPPPSLFHTKNMLP